MKLTQQNTIPLLTITGIIALGLMTIQVWIGLAFALIPAGIILALKLQNRRARPQVMVSPFAPPIKTVVSEFEITQAPRPADTSPVPVPVARTFAEPLLAILRTSGHDLDAPVILGDNNAVLVTARDIVVCIAEISKEKQDSVQELTKLMPAM